METRVESVGVGRGRPSTSILDVRVRRLRDDFGVCRWVAGEVLLVWTTYDGLLAGRDDGAAFERRESLLPSTQQQTSHGFNCQVEPARRLVDRPVLQASE